MSNECKCLKPDGGGTKCPPQHIALCIRGKDKECYGECVPIPKTFSFESFEFKDWMIGSIQDNVTEYISNNLSQLNRLKTSWIEKINESTLPNGGTLTFNSSIGKVYVRFNFEFKTDEFYPGSFENFNELTM